MGATATATDAVLAATRASLNLSLARMKMIAERSQSTEATLARTARTQASWKPTAIGTRVSTSTTPMSVTPTTASLGVSLGCGMRMEELSRSIDASLAEIACLHESMERRRETLALQMEVTAQAVACISGVKASTPTSSSAAHHDILSGSPTKFPKLDLSPKINEAGIQIPAAVVERTPAWAASAPPEPLLLTDKVMAAGDLQVENNLTVLPTRCSTIGLGVDADMQLSTFTREATLCASLTDDVRNVKLKLEVEPFSKEGCDAVMTHIGGMSLFLELGLCSTEERFAERPSKNKPLDNELADEVLTYVGGLSLFRELDMDSPMKLEERVEKAEDAMQLIWVPPSQRNRVFGVSPPCEQTASPGKSGMGSAHGVLGRAPPWRNHAFHSENLQLFDSLAMRSGLCQSVLLFKSVPDGTCLTFSWDPGEHIYVDSSQLYTLAYELLDTGKYAGRAKWFSNNEICVHPYVVAGGCSTRLWDPGILQSIYMTVSSEFITVSGFQEGASVPLTHKSNKVLVDKNMCSAFPQFHKNLCKRHGVYLNSSTWHCTGIVQLLLDFQKSWCFDGVLAHKLVVLCSIATARTWELTGTEHIRYKYIKHSGEDMVLIMNNEQNTYVSYVLYPLTVREPQGVYWIAIMHVVTWVKILDAHVQWDPSRFLSTMSGKHELNHPEQSWRMQMIGVRGYKLITCMNLSTPWDPGIVAIYETVVHQFVSSPCDLNTEVGDTNY